MRRYIGNSLLVLAVIVVSACGGDKPDQRVEKVDAASAATIQFSAPESNAVANTKKSPKPLASNPAMVVYKDAQCGCCGKWVQHMEQSGFSMAVKNSTNLNTLKQQLGIQPQYQSCHTLVDSDSGYIVEGHVPASVVSRFLTEKPEGALGLSVPAMPIGSPGMEMGGRYDAYDVLQLNRDGSTTVYQHISSDMSEAMHNGS